MLYIHLREKQKIRGQSVMLKSSLKREGAQNVLIEDLTKKKKKEKANLAHF